MPQDRKTTHKKVFFRVSACPSAAPIASQQGWAWGLLCVATREDMISDTRAGVDVRKRLVDAKVDP